MYFIKKGLIIYFNFFFTINHTLNLGNYIRVGELENKLSKIENDNNFILKQAMEKKKKIFILKC